MLPSNLLVVYKRKGEIQPRYAKFSSENLEAAKRLIETYKTHIGGKKKAIKSAITDLENSGYDYRFVRALALLLDRKSIFICSSKINPVELRKKVFQATEKLGFPTTQEKRQKIFEAVALDMALTTRTIEENLYADLDDELILEKINPPTAMELLEQYNLSLTQTLLFDSTELNFTASGNWQNLFFSIKKLGLIYEVSNDNGFWVKIDGPVSLFKLTKRYGLNIAKLLPVIVANTKWTINAKILWKYSNEICNFKMDSRKHSLLLRKQKLAPVNFDSAVEKSFATQFQALKTGWILKREPEPIPTGNQVIVPDFSLQRPGIKVYVEIVGFWTKEYIRRKAEKLKKIQVKMLLLVNEALACEKLVELEKRPQLYFIYYRNKIPLGPVLLYLEKAFEETKIKEIKFLENLQTKFTEPAVSFSEFAFRTGTSVEAVTKVLTANPPSGYTVLPNSLVSNEKLIQINNQIHEHLKKSRKLSLTQAIKIIDDEGITDESCVLTRLGYKIVWKGINSEQAQVTR